MEDWEDDFFASEKCKEFHDESLVNRRVIEEGWFTGRAEQRINQLTENTYHRMLTKPEKGFEEITREVVANWEEKNDDGHVYIRGHWVDISEGVINDFYGLPDYAEGTTDYERECADESIYMVALASLRIPGDETPWTLHTDRRPKIIQTRHLRADAKLLLRFIKSRVLPNTHNSEMYPMEAALVYAMMQQWTINIGQIICHAITAAAGRKGTKGLPFPSLISTICRRSHRGIIQGLSPLGNGKCYKTLHYDSFLGEEMERRAELGRLPRHDQEDEAAPPPRPRRARARAAESLLPWQEEQARQLRHVQRDVRYLTRLQIAQMQGLPWDSVRERSPDTP